MNSPNYARYGLGGGNVAQLDLFALLSLGVAVQNNNGLTSTKHDCFLRMLCFDKFNKYWIPNNWMKNMQVMKDNIDYTSHEH